MISYWLSKEWKRDEVETLEKRLQEAFGPLFYVDMRHDMDREQWAVHLYILGQLREDIIALYPFDKSRHYHNWHPRLVEMTVLVPDGKARRILEEQDKEEIKRLVAWATDDALHKLNARIKAANGDELPKGSPTPLT